jgi:hypothetical protein
MHTINEFKKTNLDFNKKNHWISFFDKISMTIILKKEFKHMIY